MNQLNIFLDMDGVLAQHDEYVEEKIGSNYTQEELHQLYEDPKFFENLKKTDICDFLIENVTQLYGDYSIISVPAQNYGIESSISKLRWISKELLIKPKKVIFTRNKHYYADTNNVLIDDYRPNIAAWRNAGGIGIKYKANSNHYNICDLIRLLGAL